jgi:hypothetical protein
MKENQNHMDVNDLWGFDIHRRSSVRSFLVGLSMTCVRLWSFNIPSKFWCRVGSGLLGTTVHHMNTLIQLNILFIVKQERWLWGSSNCNFQWIHNITSYRIRHKLWDSLGNNKVSGKKQCGLDWNLHLTICLHLLYCILCLRSHLVALMIPLYLKVVCNRFLDIVFCFPFTYHDIIFSEINLSLPKIKQKPHKVYQYKKANWEKIEQDLQTTHSHMKENQNYIFGLFIELLLVWFVYV